MPNFNVAKRRGKAKVKVSVQRKAAMRRIADSYSEKFDAKIMMIQELIPLGLRAVMEELQYEVKCLAGEKHSRVGNIARWGRQNGSIYLRDQKVPIPVQRLRDVVTSREIPLATYQKLQRPFDDDEGVIRKLLHGLSTHKYRESSALTAEVFGVSASNLSRRFKQGSAEKLKQIQERSLSGEDIVVVFIDGKRYADDEIMVAVGVTIGGDKIILGIEQTHRERADVIEQWMDRIITRGLRFEDGILFVIDGSKGIRKAIDRKFGPHALVQRCRWHKRENVVSYLNDAQQVVIRRRLQEAYAEPTYQKASAALSHLHRELEKVNISAANSLLEGLEETLTIHKIELFGDLAQSMNTTNCIESIMSQMGAYTDKVDRWHNSGQILRWTATGLLDIEPRLHRIKGYRHLKSLREKLKEIVGKKLQKGSTSIVQETVAVS